ncbi:MAG: SH3 domain-containing protein [Acidimicrobiia bacterium]|nr:SH3 domain-containing protein [Acidimicrobiia bacterium]
MALNLRAEPGVTGEVLALLEDDSVVILLDEQLEVDDILWQKIEVDGVTGWVAAAYLLTRPVNSSFERKNGLKHVSPGRKTRRFSMFLIPATAFNWWRSQSKIGIAVATQPRLLQARKSV